VAEPVGAADTHKGRSFNIQSYEKMKVTKGKLEKKIYGVVVEGSQRDVE
jgi:hypothetical protein